MLQAAEEVQAEVLIPAAPAAQAFLEVMITINKSETIPRPHDNPCFETHTHSEVHFALLQAFLRNTC